MAYTSEITSAQKYTIFAPFFAATRADTSAKSVDYDCVFCNQPVPPKTTGGRSFTGTAIVWTHPECLSTVPGAALSLDKRAKKKAHNAFLERQIVARKAEREAKAPEAAHVCPSVDEATLSASLRAIIEAEYDDVLTQMIQRVTEQHARIAALTQELAAFTAAAPTAAPVPALLIEDATTAAVVAAMSNPANETSIDVVKEESTPAPTPEPVAWGTERPIIGTHVGTYDGANSDQSIIRISGKKFQNPDTLKGYGYFTTSASKAALASLKPGASVQITVEGKYVTAIMPAPVSEAATAAKKARRNAKRTSAA